jgi:hypothetical protein
MTSATTCHQDIMGALRSAGGMAGLIIAEVLLSMIHLSDIGLVRMPIRIHSIRRIGILRGATGVEDITMVGTTAEEVTMELSQGIFTAVLEGLLLLRRRIPFELEVSTEVREETLLHHPRILFEPVVSIKVPLL